MAVFLDSGASAVLFGGDTMNPSTQEILDAAEGVAAERVVLPEGGVLPMPADYAFAEAATLPIAALTAWSSLATSFPLEGKTVAVLGVVASVELVGVGVGVDRGVGADIGVGADVGVIGRRHVI